MSTTAADKCCVLLVADRSLLPPECRQLHEAARGHVVLLLDLSSDELVQTGDVVVRRLRTDALLDLDRFHAELLEFLDRWPRETLADGVPFADLFRHATGHSIWWTGPGSQRHPFSGPIVPVLKSLWLTRAAIEQNRPGSIVTALEDRRTSMLVPRLCTACGVNHVSLDGTAPSRGPSVWSRRWWLARTTLSLVALPCWILVRAVYARFVTRRTGSTRDEPDSCVVLSGWYPNHVRDDDKGRPRIVYWRRLAVALQQHSPNVGVRYLLHTTTFRFGGWKRVLRPFVTGWTRLKHLEGVLPLPQCHPELPTYFRAARHQWRLMRAYSRLEQTDGLHRSTQFVGIDVSSLLVPHLRTAVGTTAKWSRNVAAVAASLRDAGNVRVVLVHEEFYPKGMLTIAAARSLGMPTVGVQHGQIGPQHAVYMPPPGHLQDALAPDWFAAYGESVLPILSRLGAYPRERIRVVGAPRFDDMAAKPLDRSECRRQLDWTPDQPVVLVTTETYRLSSPILRGLFPSAREHPDRRFVVKLHPHDRDPQAYEELLHEANCPNFELVFDRLPERLAACDVLVTGYSTTAMEGLLIGRPVVCADFTTAPERYPYIAEGAALPARHADDLRTALEDCLAEAQPADRREAFLRHHLGPTIDGHAAEMFVAMLDELFLKPEPSR